MPKTAKAKAKSANPTATPTAPGVIAVLTELLRTGVGTVPELNAELAERFPGRATDKGSMRKTIAIQVEPLHATGKLAIRIEQVEGRGTVRL